MSGIVGHRGLLLGAGGGGAGSWVTANSWTPSTTNPGWSGYTMRQRFDTSIMLAGSRIRLTFEGRASATLTMGNVQCQKQAASGDVFDYASAPIQVLFGGNPGFVLSGATTIVSDDIILATAPDSIVVGMYFSGASDLAAGGNVSGYGNYYKLGNDTTTIDASGYTQTGGVPGSRLVITKVEVFQP